MQLPIKLSLLICLLLCLEAQAQWKPQNVPTKANFRAVSAASAQVVWAGGSGGTFVRTADGGQTWQVGKVPQADSCDFRDVEVLDAQTAIVMSAGLAEKGLARIYRTTNGGQTWTLVYQSQKPGVFLDGIAFWDKKHGIAMGDPVDGKWFLLKTDDGGQTWQPLLPQQMPTLLPREAAFAASGSSLVVDGKQHVWIASGGGAQSRVFHSADRGHTWDVSVVPLPSGEAAGLFGMTFINAKNGLVVGGNYRQESLPNPNVALSRDGGQTWQALTPTQPPGLKEAIALLPADRLLTIGPSGTAISADQGQTWQALDTEGFHALVCIKGTCYAVGAKGKVAKQIFK